MLKDSQPPRYPVTRTRRTYTPQFKTELQTACKQPGASIAALALQHGMNANVLHRWLKKHRRECMPWAAPRALSNRRRRGPGHLTASREQRSRAFAGNTGDPHRAPTSRHDGNPSQGQPGGGTAAASLASYERLINNRESGNPP